jgi:hypothetical protein
MHHVVYEALAKRGNWILVGTSENLLNIIYQV